MVTGKGQRAGVAGRVGVSLRRVSQPPRCCSALLPRAPQPACGASGTCAPVPWLGPREELPRGEATEAQAVSAQVAPVRELSSPPDGRRRGGLTRQRSALAPQAFPSASEPSGDSHFKRSQQCNSAVSPPETKRTVDRDQDNLRGNSFKEREPCRRTAHKLREWVANRKGRGTRTRDPDAGTCLAV